MLHWTLSRFVAACGITAGVGAVTAVIALASVPAAGTHLIPAAAPPRPIAQAEDRAPAKSITAGPVDAAPMYAAPMYAASNLAAPHPSEPDTTQAARPARHRSTRLASHRVRLAPGRSIRVPEPARARAAVGVLAQNPDRTPP